MLSPQISLLASLFGFVNVEGVVAVLTGVDRNEKTRRVRKRNRHQTAEIHTHTTDDRQLLNLLKPKP